MKSFIQFQSMLVGEQNLPDSPHLILGKLGVNPNTVLAGPDRERVRQVQKAEKNKISPYSGKLRPDKKKKI